MNDRTWRKLRQWIILVSPGSLTFIVALWHFGFVGSAPVAAHRSEQPRVQAPDIKVAAAAPAAETSEARPTAPAPTEAQPVHAVAEASKPAAAIKVMASAGPRPPEPEAKPTTAPKPPLAAGKLTRGNFEQVRNGMTEGQLRTLLGPPGGTASKAGMMNGKLYTATTLTWRQPDATVTVTLRNERVNGKNWIPTASAQR